VVTGLAVPGVIVSESWHGRFEAAEGVEPIVGIERPGTIIGRGGKLTAAGLIVHEQVVEGVERVCCEGQWWIGRIKQGVERSGV
jgi:hypothetical protein